MLCSPNAGATPAVVALGPAPALPLRCLKAGDLVRHLLLQDPHYDPQASVRRQIVVEARALLPRVTYHGWGSHCGGREGTLAGVAVEMMGQPSANRGMWRE